MNSNERAIAAIFPDRATALAAFERLKAQGFPEPWMATTRPAEKPDRSANDVDDTSDGVLGTIGRFFTGQGNSLRRSLEDHGIEPDRAMEIDEALAPLESVVTAFVDERFSAAEAILRDAGGRIAAGGDAPFSNSPARGDDVERSLVVVDTTFSPPMLGEDVFLERRPLLRRTSADDEKAGLTDLM